MKRTLLFLALVVAGALWSSVDARWVVGERKTASQIKAGDTVVIEQSSRATFRGYYIQASTGHDGVEVLEGLGATGASVIAVEQGPLDLRTGASTVYLKLVSTGRYLGTSTDWNKGVGTAADPANAANYQILDCAQDIPWSNTYSWDDYQAGKLREGMTGDEVANWRSNGNEGGRGSDEKSVGFSYSPDESSWRYLSYWYATAPAAMMWGYTDTNQWNVYEVTYQKSLQDDLTDLIGVYTAAGATEFTGGTDPGFYDQAKADAYNTALEEALVASVSPNLSDEEYQTAINNLKNAHDAVELAQIPITEGYYYMVSAFQDFLNNFGVEKATYIDGPNQKFKYRTFDKNNVDFVFKITPTSTENEYFMQSYATDYYLGNTNVWYNAAPDITIDPEAPQHLRVRFTGMWYIGSQKWHGTSYTPYASSNPVAADGNGDITTWGQWADNCTVTNHSNLWYLRRVADDQMPLFAEQKAQALRNNELSQLVSEAKDLYGKLFVYKVNYDNALITRASGGYGADPDDDAQVSFSAIRRDGIDQSDKYEFLIDNDSTTYVKGNNFINVKLDEPKKFVTVYIGKRGATEKYPNGGKWGQEERPSLISVYGYNTADGDTIYGAPALKNITVGTTIAPDEVSVAFDKPVDRIGVEVLKNNNGVTGAFTIGAFQLYETVVDSAKAQYITVDGLKDKAEAMLTVADAKQAVVNEGTATEQDLQQLEQAISDVRGLFSDSTTLIALIADAQKLANTTPVGTALGEISDAAAAATLLAAAQSARALGLAPNATKADFDNAVQSLNAAMKAFTDKINTFEEGKWYYILNADKTEGSANAGKALYMSGANGNSLVKVGKVADGNPAYTYDPYSMWRFVKVDSASYNIQNMGTGFYLPAGALANNNVVQSLKGMAYNVSFAGNGAYTLMPQVSNSRSNVITAKGENAVYMASGNADSTTWNLVYADPEELEFITIKDFKNNSMDIFAVPYNVSQLKDLNGEDFHLYGIRKMTRDTTTDVTTIEFYEKDEIAANEPAFFKFGNPANGAEDLELLLPFPTEVSDSLIPENGIFGMLSSMHADAGTALAGGDKLELVGEGGTTISAHTGIIDPKYYTGEITDKETVDTLSIKGLVWPKEPVTPTNKSDVNGDGNVNSADIAVVYNFIANGESSNYSQAAVDVNGDGQVNSSDVAAIYSQIAGGSTASKAYIQKLLRKLQTK